MKYLISLILWVIIILAVCFIGYLPSNAEELIAPKLERTLESEVSRLSVKYGVSETLVNKIIKCESSMYGNAVNHNKLKDGTIWSTDWGYLQINDYYHQKTMEKLGLNIKDEFDSLEYGFMLLKSQGTQPWKASKLCWNK